MNFLKSLEPFGEGKTLAERLIAFMSYCGVSDECMDTIKKNIKK